MTWGWIVLVAVAVGVALAARRAAQRDANEAAFWAKREGPRYAVSPGCDGPYDFEQARQARRKSEQRQARRQRLEAGPRLVRRQPAKVTPIRRTK